MTWLGLMTVTSIAQGRTSFSEYESILLAVVRRSSLPGMWLVGSIYGKESIYSLRIEAGPVAAAAGAAETLQALVSCATPRSAGPAGT